MGNPANGTFGLFEVHVCDGRGFTDHSLLIIHLFIHYSYTIAWPVFRIHCFRCLPGALKMRFIIRYMSCFVPKQGKHLCICGIIKI